MTNIEKISLIIPLILTAASCGKFDFNRSANTDDQFHIENGNYLIPVWVRGNTASGTIIVFVQGGPVVNSLDFAKIDYAGWTNTLESDYAVAYYDQRGTGNHQGNFTSEDISMDAYLSDLHLVTEFLHKAYDARIVVMGHSFGGYLVYRYIHKYRDAVNAEQFISVNGPASNDRDTLRWEFRRQFLHNTAQNALIQNPGSADWAEVSEWLNNTPVISTDEEKSQWNSYVETLIYSDYEEKSVAFGDFVDVLFSSPYNAIPAYLNGAIDEEISEILFEDIYAFPMLELLSEIEQPILLLTGRFDDVCPPEEMTYIHEHIGIANSKLVILEDAGHESFNHQPAAFHAAIKDFIE
jgi:pimeloyl-ACP methyl ester carboxylesterase